MVKPGTGDSRLPGFALLAATRIGADKGPRARFGVALAEPRPLRRSHTAVLTTCEHPAAEVHALEPLRQRQQRAREDGAGFERGLRATAVAQIQGQLCCEPPFNSTRCGAGGMRGSSRSTLPSIVWVCTSPLT